MKSIIFLFGLLTVSFTISQHRELPHFEEGLVAYYSFNHCDARDDSGNGSNGVLYGEPGCHCGVDDDALFFDGEDDFIEFEGFVNRFFNTSDLTVSFYIKPGFHSAFEQSLLSKRAFCDLTPQLDIRWDAARAQVQTNFLENEHVCFRNLEAERNGSGWFHFALVRQGNQAFTYINGNLRGQSRRCSGVDISNETLLSFGNSPCLHGGRMLRFKGVLDELRIYDRALSAAEVAGLYSRYPVELAERDCVSMVPDKLNNYGLEGLSHQTSEGSTHCREIF